MTKLPSYLRRLRHGIYYLRWPLPKQSGSRREAIEISLGTRIPKEAQRLARYLVSSAEGLVLGGMATDPRDTSQLTFAEIKQVFREHFTARLAEAKKAIDRDGPLPTANLNRLQEAVRDRSIPDRDYWELIGRENTRNELQGMCSALGLTMPRDAGKAAMLLVEINQAQKALYEAVLRYNEAQLGYDLDAGLSEALVANVEVDFSAVGAGSAVQRGNSARGAFRSLCARRSGCMA